MPALKYKVELTEAERSHLKELIKGGEVSARKLKCALTLLNADEGLTDLEIAGALKIGLSTVGRVRARFVKEGLESALNERPRPGQKRKLNGKQEAHLVAIACSEPPAGHTHWTLKLLAGKVVELGFAEGISLETVRQALKKRTQAVEEERVAHTGSERGVRCKDGGCAGAVRARVRCGASGGLL